ncbi:MAG: CYTH domain-containing protein, partial [Gaiellaceae bacterium]
AEHQHFADSFWRTEELGEKRLNFFISLLTAAVAGLVVLATAESGFTDSQVQWVSFTTGLALLLLGLSTLLRMLRRNNVADQYKDAMNLVRESFREPLRARGLRALREAPAATLHGRPCPDGCAPQQHDRGRTRGDRPPLCDLADLARSVRGTRVRAEPRGAICLHPQAAQTTVTRAPFAPAEPRRAGREVELSLVIAADDPESVLRRLARLREVGPYVLRARGSERIVDRYFDTADGALRKQGLALRLRGVDGTTLLGLKGPRRSTSTRTEDRLEQERPFSSEAVEDVGRRIGRARAAAGSTDADSADPAAVLEAVLGVGLIQRRETARLLRDVAEAREVSGPVLAELVLDRVRFEIGDREVRHYEIEIEAKRTGRGTKAARAIAAELVTRHSDELAEWPYGKLPTGRAIEQLLFDGKLAELGPDGALTPRAYEQIRRHLERQGQ